MKPYKAFPPEITVTKIRSILQEIGIFVREDIYAASNNLYTVRISIANDSLKDLNIGTNGKGTTYLYALASGYAEFMERLQNKILFKGIKSAFKTNAYGLSNHSVYRNALVNNDVLLDFLYDPRERESSIDDEISQNGNFYKRLFPFLENETEVRHFLSDTLGFESFVTVPFYSLSSNNEIFLPLEAIWFSCGSNGMASGNTKEEAIIQGFCEIFERYAGYEIYRKNLTPPNIPLEEFERYPVYKILQELINSNNYKLYVKDCSLGIGLPVLGVLVIDEQNGKYNFNLGSALDSGIALERCLTELYQSSEGMSWYDIRYEQYCDNDEIEEEYAFINGSKLFVDGSGYWPKSLFSSSPSYCYNKLIDGLNNSDDDDLTFIKNKVGELGFEIYIRDVSFMGFPTYYIVIPGMSQYASKEVHYSVLSETISHLHKIRNIHGTSDDELRNLCTLINRDYKYLKLLNYNFNELIVYHNDTDLLDLDLELLLCMLNYRIGNVDKAYFYISEFLEGKNFAVYNYYQCIKDYLSLILKGYNEVQIQDQLSTLYSDVIDEVIKDMANPKRVLEGYDWPACFNCEKCGIQSKCRQIDFLRIYKQIQDCNKQHPLRHSRDFI